MLSDMSHGKSKTMEIVEEYLSSLQDLRSNSKPHINMLTQLAEEYIQYASAIVEVVEDHLQKVRFEIKLPVLYLIDSIVKNLRGVYLNLFQKNIIHTFCHVFEKVDEGTRSKLWKLRNTWNGIFPDTLIYDLDVRVNRIDPAWPIASKNVANSAAQPKIVHVNPKFLQQQNAQKLVAEDAPTKTVSANTKNSAPTVLKNIQSENSPTKILTVEETIQEQKMREELLKKHKELQELKKKKLELAAMQKKARLIQSEVAAAEISLKESVSAEVVKSLERLDKQPLISAVPKVSSPNQSSDKPLTPTIRPTDPRVKTAATLQNGKIETELKKIPSPKSKVTKSSRSHSTSPKGQKSPRLPSPPPPPVTKPRERSISPIQSKQEQRNPSPPALVSSSSKSSRSSSGSASKHKSRSNKTSPHKKSRKRSRSPSEHHRHHHRHHRQHRPKDTSLEEELFGSAGASPPQPIADNKSSSSSSRRRRVKENKSPEVAPREESKRKDSTSSTKDEDLRVAPTVIETKEDLDLRVLPPIPNKRQSSDANQAPKAKKSKDETFDELFGKEDVDLRLLAPTVPPPTVKQSSPTPVQPATPPPPVISNEKDNWANFKSSDHSRNENNRTSRPARPNKVFNKPPPSDRRSGREYNERNSDRNIEIIMREAAEQLNQGTITKAQYNKLIQEVLHMSEDQKLKAAQRKEWENKGWERNEKGSRMKEHGIHQRPPGPRWQSPWHQPWAHPPGPFGMPPFRPDFRPMGPWQNHPRLFPGPMRPDFHHPFHGYNPRLGPPPPQPPIGPNGPLLLPNGPMIGPMGPMPPSVLMPSLTKTRFPATDATNSKMDTEDTNSSNSAGSPTLSVPPPSTPTTQTLGIDELPPPDIKLLEEISKDTMKSINIDNVPREIRYYGDIGVIFMHWDDPRDIGFQNGARRISIDGKEIAVCSFNDDYREFVYEGETHKIKLGAPTRELFIDDKWYQGYFGGQPIAVELNGKKVNVKLDGPPPQVKIGSIKRTDLVVGKINLIINARSMVPVFLDAKPQIFEIEGKPCTLEFMDSLQTVLLNGKPFPVEFGGLPKPVTIQGKKHFIRFSVLPRGFKAGYVTIAGMRGEPGKDMEPTRTPQFETSTTPTISSPIEPDSTSQDGLDQTYMVKSSELQVDVLSSMIPSAMAPSSGLSYQAEPAVETAAAPAPAVQLPVDLSTLFQRLVETGIVSNLVESKKLEEEENKTPEAPTITFDKPETLKIKQPGMATALYSGIQCSSCGARFAPEMATHYSRHLDWHFRQNRKERDSSRKAHSRLWYYVISDWIQFEEIEDLEDRAQSWFETEKQTLESENAAAEELFAETMQPSVPTGSDDEAYCQVCHEVFEQFYNDEKEEWHLRPAVTYDDKNFHPLCLDDYKRSLEESVVSEDLKENVSETLNDENSNVKVENNDEKVEIKAEPTLEPGEELVNILSDIDIKVEPIKDEDVELENDDIEKHLTEKTQIEDNDVEMSETIDQIEKEMKEPSESVTENTEINDIEMKEEPIDNDLELNNIEEVLKNVKKEPVDNPDDELEEEENIIETVGVVADSTQVEVKSTIDGNVELESTPSVIPMPQSKIVINISKPITIVKEPKEVVAEPKPVIEDEEVEPPVPSEPKSLKPALANLNLTVLPPIVKGEELSGLCSIM